MSGHSSDGRDIQRLPPPDHCIQARLPLIDGSNDRRWAKGRPNATLPKLKHDQEGQPRIYKGTALSVVTFDGTTFLFYQTSDGALHRIVENADGSVTYENLDFSPSLCSPLASISWEEKDKKELRLYYLDNNYKIKEFCCTRKPGEDDKWYNGGLNDSDAGATVKANPSAGLSAIVYLDDKQSGVHLRVYYQDFDTLKIMQLGIDDWPQWWYDESLIVAFGGTGIAAVTYPIANDEQGIRYYYQDTEVKLKERVFDGSDWSDGDFQPGQVTVRGPISADVKDNFIYVYWRNLDTKSVVGTVGIDPNADDPPPVRDIGAPSDFQQAALVLNGQLRFYYQDKQGQLGYYYSNDGGDNWYPMGTN